MLMIVKDWRFIGDCIPRRLKVHSLVYQLRLVGRGTLAVLARELRAGQHLIRNAYWRTTMQVNIKHQLFDSFKIYSIVLV